MNEWYKNPTILIVAGVGIFAAVILMRNQNSSTSATNTSQQTSTDTTTTPVGQSYTYLDGSGVQHIIATDPNGAITQYAAVPPSTSTPYAGEMSSYVGSWGLPMPSWTPPSSAYNLPADPGSYYSS